jgi:hypothetical protein
LMALAEGTNPFVHCWDLLLHDRVAQIIMADFTFFFLWVFCWMVDDGKRRWGTILPWMVVGIAGATWMITLYIITRGAKKHSMNSSRRNE